MYRKRKFVWALFAVVLALSVLSNALVACAPAPATPTPPPKATAPAQATPAVQPTPTDVAKPAPTPTPVGPALAKDQVLRHPTTEPPTLDPGLATDSVSIDIVINLFEGLLEFDDAGNPKPLIAEKWDISKDGLTYTFTLRKGPKWSNGDPVTAKDFEYAWKRNLDPATASDYATSLYPIKGAEAFNTKKTTDPNTVGVTAKDDQTLVVTLEEPAAYFLRLVSTWTAFPLPRKAIEQHKDKWTEAGNIVTNGPFKLESWKHDQEMVLVRNNDYWGPKPTLEKVVYKIFAETDQELAQELAAYENGEIDVTRGIPPADVDRVKADPKLGKELVVNDISGTYFIVPNSGKKPFDDPRVRRALSLVIDPNKVIDIIKTPAKPADSIMPIGILGRKPDAYDKRPDVAKAKQLLAEAGYPNGQGFPEFTYTYNTAATHKAIAEYLQEVWSKELGLKVKLENMEWKVFLKWRREANYDVYRGGWLSDYEDPNNWFNMLLDSAQSDEVFAPHWKNDKFDQLVRQARGEVDANKRKALYEQADEILAKELPFIPIYYYAGQRLVKPYVQGYNPGRVLDMVYFKNVKILERR